MNHQPDSIFVPDFKLGHWTHPGRLTGCSVILANSLVPAAVDVLGCAPGTRETSLLEVGKSIQSIDAILLTGGSAFGLGAADGVMEWLRQRERGFPTSSIPVPIVAGAVIFDLQGNDPVWPSADHGFAAVSAASDRFTGGRVGGGTGALVSKTRGRSRAIDSGIGIARVSSPAGDVTAVFVNNAFGDVFDAALGEYLTRPLGGSETSEEIILGQMIDTTPGENTVIGALLVHRPMDHDALHRITVAGHDGIARVIRPAHTPADGDAVFAVATEPGTTTTADLTQLTAAAQLATARALLDSISHQSAS